MNKQGNHGLVESRPGVRTRTFSFCPGKGIFYDNTTPPTPVGLGLAWGLIFDADGETAVLMTKIPSDWDGASDLTFTIVWTTKNGVVIANTETVIWKISWRSRALGEIVNDGTAVSQQVTYTQSGAGTHLKIISSELTLDHDNTDQPISAGDCLFLQLSRDMTNDTYGDDAIVVGCSISYTSNNFSEISG